MKEIVKVKIEGRDDVGLVVKKENREGVTIVTADFGAFKVSAPAEIFEVCHGNH